MKMTQNLIQFSKKLKTRQVLLLPPVSEDDRRLPAALLANRARAWHDMARLRLASGSEIPLKLYRKGQVCDVVVHEACEEDDEAITADDDEPVRLHIVAVFPLFGMPD